MTEEIFETEIIGREKDYCIKEESPELIEVLDVEVLDEDTPKGEDQINTQLEEASLLMRYAVYYHKSHRTSFIRRSTDFPITNMFVFHEMEELSDKIDTLTLTQMLLLVDGQGGMSQDDINKAKDYLAFIINSRVGRFLPVIKEFFKKDKDVPRMIKRKEIPPIPSYFS